MGYDQQRSEKSARSQDAYFEGDWVSLSYAQGFLYLVSSSINVSIFHIMWLDTLWTDLPMFKLELETTYLKAGDGGRQPPSWGTISPS